MNDKQNANLILERLAGVCPTRAWGDSDSEPEEVPDLVTEG